MSRGRRSRAAALTVALALAPALAGAEEVDRVKVEVEVAGEEGLSIAGFDLTGNELSRNIEALLSVEAERKDDLTVSRLRRLHARAEQEIRTALEPFGYYRPAVQASLTRDSEGGDAWTARYRVEPGPRMTVAEVAIELTGEGADEPAIRTAAEEFPLAPSDPLLHPAYEEGKSRLVSDAFAAGYLDAELERSELRVDLDAYEASVEIVFDTGPRYRFGEVTFEQDVLDPDLLAGYVTFEPGEPLDLDELLTFQSALSDSPYFRRVEVLTRTEEAGADARVPIVVEMAPAAAQKWDLGLGYGTDTGPRGTVELDLRRINRRGHRAASELTLSDIEQSGGVRYLIPGPYPRTDVTTFTLGYAELNPDTSRSEIALVGVGRTESRSGWREALGLIFQRTDFEVGVDNGVSELLIPEASWSRVRADDRIYTRKGERIEFGFRAADDSVLSDSSFFQAGIEGKAVRSFGDFARAIGRVSVGHTWTSDFRRLPPEIRFFAGGDSSVRGYPFQGLGRLDEAGNVIGGEALLSASLEIDSLFLDLDRFGRWGAAAFYDVGGAGRDLGDRLERGAGAGVRWLSPIGLVRADVAWAVSEPGTPIRFHLMIGPDL